MSAYNQVMLVAGSLALAAVVVGPEVLESPLERQLDGALIERLAERQLGELADRIGLTDQQEALVRPIVRRSLSRRREVLKRSGLEPGQPPPEALREELALVRDETRRALSKVLSVYQLATYDKWVRERQQPMESR